uniref:Uncharacterized protein n=1 Tax=viral metagenome TaxID=1070528 RepID=A0A6M3LW97_9ZZZZ
MVDYSQLYYHREVRVKKEAIKPYPIDLDIEINDFNRTPDCKVGHFGYNFYLRTNAGLKMKPYSSEKRLEKAVEKLLIKNGFEILGWISKN